MRRQHPHRRPSERRRQSGAVAVLVGIALLAMVGITGLALDLGKLYVAKSELQSSADACALAAAQELTGANDKQLLLAEAAGRIAGSRHKVLFQSYAVGFSDVNSITFSADNKSGSYTSANATTTAANSIRYVRCMVQRTGIPTWFIQVLNTLPGSAIDAQTVNATAVATLKPSQSTCALPVGVCGNSTKLVAGNWYLGVLDPNDSQIARSDLKWVDFTPPSGGANEIAAQLRGSGACNVPTVNTFVGESGSNASLGTDYNTRFGIYHGNTTPDDSPPDFSGYAYTLASWNSGRNAFADFASKRGTNVPYQKDSVTGLKTRGGIKDANFLKQHGRDRRVMPAPLMDCGKVINNTMPIMSWGCFFLLHPINNNLGNTGTQYPRMMLEYLGDAKNPGSPCVSYGIPGGPGVNGPLVATLVK